MNEEIILEKFAERFSTLIKNSSYDVPTLAEKLGIKSKSTIYRYMNAEMAPKIPTVKYASEIFNVNPLWLMGYDVPMHKEIKKDKFGNIVTAIPLLGTVKAGYDYLAQENWEGTIDIKEELAKTGEFFALRIKGDSMFETLWENDIVAVKKQDIAENKDIVVALINGEEATVKQYIEIPSGIILRPLNRTYDDLIFTKEEIETKPVKIIGVVKRLIERDF